MPLSENETYHRIKRRIRRLRRRLAFFPRARLVSFVIIGSCLGGGLFALVLLCPIVRGDVESSLMHYVVKRGNQGLVRAALTFGFDVNVEDESGFAPLHHVIMLGDSSMVKLLLEHGADPSHNAGYYQWTPLHGACAYGRKNIGEILIAREVDVNARDFRGLPPLYFAVKNGYLELSRSIVSHGAELNVVLADGETLLHTMVIENNRKAVEILLTLGAASTILDDSGRAALHQAASRGNVDIVEMLIASGSLVNLKDSNGWAPLHHATAAGSTKTVETLVTADANVNARTDRQETALHLAAGLGQMELASLLIAKGAAVNASDEKGWTPLHTALSAGNIEIAEFLVSKGARYE